MPAPKTRAITASRMKPRMRDNRVIELTEARALSRVMAGMLLELAMAVRHGYHARLSALTRILGVAEWPTPHRRASAPVSVLLPDPADPVSPIVCALPERG